MQLGFVLTSAADLGSVQAHARALSADVLKVVTGWGLPWTPELRRAALRLTPASIIRTVHGDPSYGRDADHPWGRHPMLHAEHVVAEIQPWWDARDPSRPFWIELGNEPLLDPLPGHRVPPETFAWDYRTYLAETIAACRLAFPGAKLIAPAHIQNHPIRIGDEQMGQTWMTAICADVYRQCDALGLHAYSFAQLAQGRDQLKRFVSNGMPIWLTEFALNEPLTDALRGAQFANLLRGLDLAGVTLYHLDEIGGTDPAHFQANYRLNPTTLAAFAQAWRSPVAPVPAPTPKPAPAPAPAPTPAPAPKPAPSKPAPRGLATLTIRDLRPELEKTRIKDRIPARRKGKPRGSVLHYNGPAVAGFGNIGADLRQILGPDVTTHQTSSRVRGDTLQYHFCVLSNGDIVQTRDIELPASHAAHPEANGFHIAIHLPLGGLQDATPEQWAATLRLHEALAEEYGWNARTSLTGHEEWSDTLCPGPRLLARLNAYRSDQVAGGIYRVRRDVAAALVREGPGQSFPVALQGKARAWPGDTIDADAVVAGEPVGGDARWLHRRDGLGFVHISLVEALA